MSITVENGFAPDDAALDQRAHFVPCHIADDGPANVKKYFEPYINKNENGELSASLRGRPLRGCELVPPAGHACVLLSETRRPLAQDAERKLQVAGGFKRFISWNYDKSTSQNDAVVRALEWIDIAEAIHED